MNKFNIAIVGYGFVGKAVAHGFATKHVEQHIVDPKGGLDISELSSKRIDMTFVCVPTPMSDDGSIDASIAIETIKYLNDNVSGLIVLKSTVTPDIVAKFAEQVDRFIYNPEFLTERNYAHDFEYPSLHVFGGKKHSCELLHSFYTDYSICHPCPVHYVGAKEASLIKYGINSFLATKVTWFNEYYKTVNKFNANFDNVASAMASDPRIGTSHMQVPGHDGRMGFGGACFTKDCNALISLTKNLGCEMELLTNAVNLNNSIRSQYTELDDREKEQNVKYTKEKK